MNITANELDYLTAIMTDDYNDQALSTDDTAEDIAGNPVWSWSPAAQFGASAGGIASSLCKKCLAHAEGEGEEQTIEITLEGAKALKAN